jgi:hypothetical protein
VFFWKSSTSESASGSAEPGDDRHPITASLAEELCRIRVALGAFCDGWIFPQQTKGSPVG